MMQVMTAVGFTVTDLSQRPEQVLAACDRLSVVIIRSRSGKVYRLQVEVMKSAVRRPDFGARRKVAGMKPATKQVARFLDRLIAGG